MATNAEEITAEGAKESLLACISELRALDTAGAIGQVQEELRADPKSSFTTWHDITDKIEGRSYTMYGTLHQDVQAVMAVLGIPDKKRSRLQKTCAKVLKDMKRHWGQQEVNVRMWLYAWHPQGHQQAHLVRICDCDATTRSCSLRAVLRLAMRVRNHGLVPCAHLSTDIQAFWSVAMPLRHDVAFLSLCTMRTPLPAASSAKHMRM